MPDPEYIVWGCSDCLQHAPASSLPDTRERCGICGGRIVRWTAERIAEAERVAREIAERKRK